jgi:polysaccharide biosynthesis transport protein
VTSSTANEGKSTISLALARAYALARNSVVIVDCDLRKPTLHRMLGLSPSGALTQYLNTDSPLGLAGLVAVDPVTSLHAVVGSEPSEIPTDQLVTGPAFAQLLEGLRAAYDIVVLDTPPIGPVVDGLYLAQMAHYLVFVLRAGATSQTEARMAIQSLRNAKAANAEIVTILNQQDRASASYKGKYASYYLDSA